MASSPVLFILSGLFLMNTVMNRSDSFPFFVGEVLCFGVAPLLLALGVITYAVAPGGKKPAGGKWADAVPSAKEELPPVNPVLLLTRRVIGFLLGIAFLVPPLIEGPLLKGDWSFFLAMFVLLPYLTLPYLVAVLRLLSKKRPRKIDVFVIVSCTLMLLSWHVAPPLTMISAVLIAFALILTFITRVH